MTPNVNYNGASDATLSASRSLLRIAIPSWRFVGIHVEPEPEPETVSREELQTLFHGELSPKAQKRLLTDQETAEKSLADRIRQALYPHDVSA